MNKYKKTVMLFLEGIDDKDLIIDKDTFFFFFLLKDKCSICKDKCIVVNSHGGKIGDIYPQSFLCEDIFYKKLKDLGYNENDLKYVRFNYYLFKSA